MHPAHCRGRMGEPGDVGWLCMKSGSAIIVILVAAVLALSAWMAIQHGPLAGEQEEQILSPGDHRPSDSVASPSISLQEVLAHADIIPSHRHPLLGRQAPGFELADPQGKVWSLNEFLPDGPTARTRERPHDSSAGRGPGPYFRGLSFAWRGTSRPLDGPRASRALRTQEEGHERAAEGCGYLQVFNQASQSLFAKAPALVQLSQGSRWRRSSSCRRATSSALAGAIPRPGRQTIRPASRSCFSNRPGSPDGREPPGDCPGPSLARSVSRSKPFTDPARFPAWPAAGCVEANC